MQSNLLIDELNLFDYFTVWQYGLSSFQAGGIKLEKICLRINISTQTPC